MGMEHFRFAKFSVLVGLCLHVVPATAQMKMPDIIKMPCGQKIVIQDYSCPKGLILEITGSCRDNTTQLGKGVQYTCIKPK
jgi:NADP-dependent 3-hydroxy acid dehydrogenase YdfG